MLAKNCSIEEFADELRRRNTKDDKYAQTDCGTLSRFVIDQVNAQSLNLAKECGLWIDFADVLRLGMPAPSGVENDVYLSHDGHTIYKVNNLMTSKTVLAFFDRVIIHNSLFPQTAYKLLGFTGFGGISIYPVLSQDFIPYEREATPIEIETYMVALGFVKVNDTTFTNNQIVVSDLHPRNVLRDRFGDIYVIDAEFAKIRC